MKNKMSENIRSLRRERNMTQEQLAEALGVTVGAVSKWESGATTPELDMIVGMADFFETSVDVLVGYELHSGGRKQAATKIKELMLNKSFEEGSSEAEKALQKYPNSFQVVYNSAALFCMRGLEQSNRRFTRRALELYRRALELVGQSEDDNVGEVTIQNRIAETHLMLGETDQALEQFKKSNVEGLNNAAIGYTLATVSHRPDEALPYLSDSLWGNVSTLFRVAVGMSNAYEEKEEFQNGLDILRWACSLFEGLSASEKRVTYLTRGRCILLAGCASAAVLTGDSAAAKEYLRQARECACRFDASPVYGMTGLKFFHCKNHTTAFDDFGETATAGLRAAIDDSGSTAPTLSALWKELDEER